MEERASRGGSTVLHERVPPGEPLLEVADLVKTFPIRTGLLGRQTSTVQAVSGVSFDLRAGETLGLVGESGCGKSTTGRTIMRILDPTAGTVRFHGQDLGHAPEAQVRQFYREIQIVFQDPYASLNPRMTVRDIVGEPLKAFGDGDRTSRRHRVNEALEQVGLLPEHGSRFPHEFSGGQRQRIGIARALVLRPQALVLDEPVSALDVSIQAQIVNLLQELQAELGLAYLFIAHDLSVIRHICDRVAVMYLGKIVEIGTRNEIFTAPQHPYTNALMSAVPIPDPRMRGKRTRIVLSGDVPSPADPPSGCRFRTRCWKADDRCAQEEPALVTRADGVADHHSACHYPEGR